MDNNILFELGIVLFLGFFAAMLIKKTGLSVIAGYILVGLLIGPHALGLVKGAALTDMLSELGIVFLMFFLGLEFSLNKFNKIKSSVFFIGTYEVLLNLAVGYVIGLVAGFPLTERLFLAGIVALSSSGVVAKLLFDMRRTASGESEILMGVMVFEDFFAIVILGILSSFAMKGSLDLMGMAVSLGKAVIFYAVFILIGVFFIDKVIDYLTKIESQELFTALMLGMILLVSALAKYIGLASAAGAFLLGMMITSYDVEQRLHRTVSAFKDIFLIIFFISFGILLDPAKMPGVLWLVVIAVPVTLLGEIIISSSATYFSGFTSKSAFAIGTSMIARGEYSMIYATMALAIGSTASVTIYQFTGLYVLIMTLLSPLAMKNSESIRKAAKKLTPPFARYSARLVSITLKPLLMPEESGITNTRRNKFLPVFCIYLIVLISMFAINDLLVNIILMIPGLLLILVLRWRFRQKIEILSRQPHNSNNSQDDASITVKFKTAGEYMANMMSAVFMVLLLSALVSKLGYIHAVILAAVFVVVLMITSIYIYIRRDSGTKKLPL